MPEASFFSYPRRRPRAPFVAARPAPARSAVWLASLACCAGPTWAQASDALLIDASERGLRTDIEWLADRRVISLPLTTWPLPMATVREAMEAASSRPTTATERDALGRIEAALQRLQAPATASFEVNTGPHLSFDGESAPRARAEAAVAVQHAGDRVAGRLRLSANDDSLARQVGRASLDGSYVATLWRGVSFSYGLLDRWLGPGRYASPLLGDSAPPVPTVTMRRAVDDRPGWDLLRWVGPWGYEISIGQLQRYTPAQARTLNLRAYMRPLDGLEIGASRFIYWAGDGRPSGFSALTDALLGRSNIPRGSDQEDPSNEIAGFDVRYARPNGFGGANVVYAHLLGEDEKNYQPFKRFGTIGAQFKMVRGGDRHEWTLEATDTHLSQFFATHDYLGSAYRHSTYTDGHYHRGLPLGAPIGGAGQSLSLGWAWMPAPGRGFDRFTLVGTYAEVSENGRMDINRSFPETGRVHSLQARLEGHRRGGMRWFVGPSYQHATAAERPDIGLVGGVEVEAGFFD
jgi:hypothetical protein